MGRKHFTLIIATLLVVFPLYAKAQGGLCSQMINGKYHQVPCTYQNPQPSNQQPATQPTPSGPSQEELDRQAREREDERKRKEADRKRQEDAVKAAEEAAKQAEFIQKRDEATTELKGLGSDTTPKLKEINDKRTDPCAPSQSANVVDLCFNDAAGKVMTLEMPKDIHPDDRAVIISLQGIAKKRGMSEAEQYRLSKAMFEMNADGTGIYKIDILNAWEAVTERRITPALLASARKAKATIVFPAGQQKGYGDCAIFALATATGRPYSVVSAAAIKLMREEDWRTESERRDPVGVIRKTGVTAGEVAFIAEEYGRVQVVPSSEFQKTLRDGKPVMIGVIPSSLEGRHQVVLTKSFEHDGATWYEMVDSNAGFRKLYLNEKELQTILLERGIVYSPEPGTTPNLIGKPSARSKH